MSTTYDDGHCTWNDFESEPNITGDGSGDPDTHYLTIRDEDGEELAVICHRTCDGKYPLDGDLANRKRHNAQVIVDALNNNYSGYTHAGDLR